jgi:hypothetical protein
MPCPFNILLLAVPGLVVIFWAVKGLVPTRLRFAGGASGLLASSIATVAYCFHCPEMSPAFWAIWYVAAMLLPAAVFYHYDDEPTVDSGWYHFTSSTTREITRLLGDR